MQTDNFQAFVRAPLPPPRCASWCEVLLCYNCGICGRCFKKKSLKSVADYTKGLGDSGHSACSSSIVELTADFAADVSLTVLKGMHQGGAVVQQITRFCDVVKSPHSCGGAHLVCCWWLSVRGCCCRSFKGPLRLFLHVAGVMASIIACAPWVLTGSNRLPAFALTVAFVF